MPDLQDIVFRWVADQPAGIGLLLAAGGLLSGFLGFRVFAPLLVLGNAGLGCLLGTFLSQATGLPWVLVAVPLGLALLVGSAKLRRPALALGCGGTIGLVGLYLCGQLGLDGLPGLLAGGFVGTVGLLMGLVCPRAMQVVLTTLQGSILLILAFVGVSDHLMPAVGTTFRQWAASQSLLVPIMLGMLCVMTYSYQAMHQQGDITTGAT